jgi:uncharacterized RDD family membrane protein YckC
LTDQEPDQQDDATADGMGESAAADLGPRFLARLIDGVILGVVFVVIIVPIVVVAIFSGSSGFGSAFGGFSSGGFVAGIVWAVIIVGYFAVMESSRGQTVGKMLMKLKTQGPDGQNPSLEMAIKRNIWYALGIIPVIGGLAQLGAVIYIAVTISSSPTNTGWHDTFAGGTRVVKTG